MIQKSKVTYQSAILQYLKNLKNPAPLSRICSAVAKVKTNAKESSTSRNLRFLKTSNTIKQTTKGWSIA